MKSRKKKENSLLPRIAIAVAFIIALNAGTWSVSHYFSDADEASESFKSDAPDSKQKKASFVGSIELLREDFGIVLHSLKEIFIELVLFALFVYEVLRLWKKARAESRQERPRG